MSVSIALSAHRDQPLVPGTRSLPPPATASLLGLLSASQFSFLSISSLLSLFSPFFPLLSLVLPLASRGALPDPWGRLVHFHRPIDTLPLGSIDTARTRRTSLFSACSLLRRTFSRSRICTRASLEVCSLHSLQVPRSTEFSTRPFAAPARSLLCPS